MPKLTYKPEGADPRVWEFDFDKLMSPERIALERATGLGWLDIKRGFMSQSSVVLDAFLHVLMKRDIPTLKLPNAHAPGQIEWCGAELESDLSDAEAVDFIQSTRDNDDPEVREAIEMLLAERPGVAQLLAETEAGTAPKDDSPEG